MNLRSLPRPEKWILWGIPVLFLIGSLLHFAYDASGKSPVVGLFAPVNESIWEHTKMVLWSMILWWSLYYCFRGASYGIEINKWFTGAVVALITSLVIMPMLYYFYTGAFGVELLWVDILIMLLSVLFGQLLGLHVYRYGNGLDWRIAVAVFVALILVFVWFTFQPPHIPLFLDGVTGSYGIS